MPASFEKKRKSNLGPSSFHAIFQCCKKYAEGIYNANKNKPRCTQFLLQKGMIYRSLWMNNSKQNVGLMVKAIVGKGYCTPPFLNLALPHLYLPPSSKYMSCSTPSSISHPSIYTTPHPNLYRSLQISRLLVYITHLTHIIYPLPMSISNFIHIMLGRGDLNTPLKISPLVWNHQLQKQSLV